MMADRKDLGTIIATSTYFLTRLAMYTRTMTLAQSLILLCRSISPVFLFDLPAYANPATTQFYPTRSANLVSDRHIQLDPNPKDRQQSSFITEKPDSPDNKNPWYGGFGIGISSTNLNGTSKVAGMNVSGINVPFNLDIDTKNQTSFNAFAGHKFSNFRAEGEVLYTNNALKNGSLPLPSLSAPMSISSGDLNGNISNLAIMLNGYYDINTGSAFKPFLGVGIGYSSTNLNVSTSNTNVALKGASSGMVYQVKVGASYSVSEKTDLYLQYRHINAPFSGNLTIDGTSINSNTSGMLNSNVVEFGSRLNF
jgi:opacity protein-like surface antigen